jgi:L,D-transpeptidase catalytic domain/Putative peptidoglycan binding domain
MVRSPMARVVAGFAVVALTLLAGCGPSTTGAAPAATTATSVVTAAPSTSSATPSTSESSTTPSASANSSTPTPPPTETQTTSAALTAGPAIYHSGDTGDAVRDLQVRMRQLAWYSGRITGTYDSQTVTGVTGFQGKRGFPVTGEVDQRTLDRLRSMTRTPTANEKNNVTPPVTATGAIDPRCLTGHVLCIDKSTRKLRWMVDGQVVKVFDVRFGSELTPTREGSFTVSMKSRNQVSTLYHTAMPFAMFFSGGQAVHYSADFAARGYNGASHGCINVRDYNGIAWLFDQVSIGNAVIVYRS